MLLRDFLSNDSESRCRTSDPVEELLRYRFAPHWPLPASLGARILPRSPAHSRRWFQVAAYSVQVHASAVTTALRGLDLGSCLLRHSCAPYAPLCSLPPRRIANPSSA